MSGSLRWDPRPLHCSGRARPAAAAAPGGAGPLTELRPETADPNSPPVQPPRADQAPATLTDAAAAHLPRTPDAGAAGSPSGGGLLPRSPSRDVPPVPEVASAIARAAPGRASQRLQAAGTPGVRGHMGPVQLQSAPEEETKAAPARAGCVSACPNAASRPRPRRTLPLLLGPAHVALGFSIPP